MKPLVIVIVIIDEVPIAIIVGLPTVAAVTGATASLAPFTVMRILLAEVGRPDIIKGRFSNLFMAIYIRLLIEI